MGIYYNPGNSAFQDALNSEIYVDKSGLLEFTNRIIDTKQKLLCVSRPRRFGKSMAAEMLMAYYSRGCDSGAMFQGLKIASSPSFHKHLNQYDVLYLDIQNLWSTAAGKKDSGHFLDFLQHQENALSLSLTNGTAYSGKQKMILISRKPTSCF